MSKEVGRILLIKVKLCNFKMRVINIVVNELRVVQVGLKSYA